MTMQPDHEAYRILLVEDEPVSAQTIDFLLRKLGHELVERVATGEEAVVRAQALQPDVILMDIQLEGEMDGLEAARQIRQVMAGTPISIIFLTGLELLGSVHDMLANADCFIQKPVKITDLAANLHICIQRRRLEQQLALSERRYQALVENAPVGIYESYADGRLASVNPALAEMFGFDTPQEMLDTIRNLNAQIYVEEGRRDELLDCLAQQGKVQDFESQVYGRDGDVFWVHEEAALGVDASGEPINEGFLLDITDRKDAEFERDVTMHLLKQTLDALPEPLVLMDEGCEIILGNAGMCAITQCSIPEELAGQDFRQVLSPSSLRAWDDFWARFLVNDQPMQVRLLLEHVNSWYIFTVSPYKSPEGERIGAVCLGRFAAPGQLAADAMQGE